MKSVVKKVLPAPMVEYARQFLRARQHRGDTVYDHYTGGNGAVLPCAVAYNRLGAYCVPLSSRHRPANRRVVSGEVWEPETIAFLSEHCRGGDIVHAGTYFGDFLPALSAACGEQGKVWAFEPNPESYRCAGITVLLNGLRNVELTNAGLGAQRGRLSMKVLDATGMALGGASQLVSSADVEGTPASHLATVDILAVDDVIPRDRRVAVIQLDVEGFEGPALDGAVETIKRWRPILVLESLPDEAWLSDRILSLGYRISGTVHDNTILESA